MLLIANLFLKAGFFFTSFINEIKIADKTYPIDAIENGIIKYDFSSPFNKNVMAINVTRFPIDEILLIPAIKDPLFPLEVISVRSANQFTVITADAREIAAYIIISSIGPETKDNDSHRIESKILAIINHGLLNPELSLNFPKNICVAFDIEFPRARSIPISIGEAPSITPYTPIKEDAVVAPDDIKNVLILTRNRVFLLFAMFLFIRRPSIKEIDVYRLFKLT